MSSGGAGRSASRVRVFIAMLWVVGSLVAAFAIYEGVSPLRITDTGEWIGPGVDDDEYPWEDPDVAVVAVDAEGFFAAPAGDAVLRLTAAEAGTAPLLLSTDDEDAYVATTVSDPEELGIAPGPDHPWPEDYFGRIYPDSPGVFVPAAGGLELWFESDIAWEGRITPLEATALEDVETGTGDEFLYYTGDAISARLQYDGDRYITVQTYSAGGRDFAISDEGPVDARFAWPDAGSVVIRVETYDDENPWQLTIEGGTASGSTPEPTPDPTSTPEE